MPFNHIDKNRHFLHNPGNEAGAFGVSVIPAAVKTGQTYWKFIGVYHLSGEENHGQSNVFLEALDEQGRRVIPAWVGWTWDGRTPSERADPVALDKPATEPAGNINLGFNQTVTVRVNGPNRDSEDISDKVTGLHTRHGGVSTSGNYSGHHSFYVLWQRAIAGQKPDPEPEPDPDPPPAGTITKTFEDEEMKITLVIEMK